MTGQLYRKRPVTVEALQFDGDNLGVIMEWIASQDGHALLQAGRLLIRTREGDMEVSLGDYVIREPRPTEDRRFYPCKPDIFAASYEPVVNR